MANVDPEYINNPRHNEREGSIALRNQSPKTAVIQPLNLKKPRPEQSNKTGKGQPTDRDTKSKRLVLEDDMVYPTGPDELADPVLSSFPAAASSSSQSSASRKPPSPSRRRSSRLSSYQHSATAPPSPRHNNVIAPIDTSTPHHSSNVANNHSRKSNSYSRSHSTDYTGYSPVVPTQQSDYKSFHESPQTTASRRSSYFHHRQASAGTASSRRGLSQHTFDYPNTDTISYSYSPEEYNRDGGHLLDEEGESEIPMSMGMPNLQMASNAVMKANLRSGDPYQELSRFLDNVNGMLSSLTLSIPHLQLLCDRYRSIQEKLLEYNALVEVNRTQEGVIEQKEKQIFSLKEKLEQMATIHSAEGSRLRNKIGSLEAEIRIFNDIIAAKNDEIEDLASRFEEEKELLQREREQWGAVNGEAFEEEKIELLEKHEAEIEILEEGHQGRIKEIEESHFIEKRKMIEAYESKIKGLQETHHAELNVILEEKSNELDHLHRQVSLKLENNHAVKIAALKDAHSADMRALESKFYAKLETLKVDVGKRKAELEKAHAAEKKLLEEAFQKERTIWLDEKEQLEGQIKYLQYEKNTTAFTHEAEKSSLIEMIESSKQTSINLEKENEKVNALLKKIGESDMGQEIKGRGDGFYIDAFTTLTKDIVDISTKFLDLPRMPPDDVIAEIPSHLPNILADTDASRILRQAYIQHLISAILCRRIFSPFLFSLANRYDNADSLLKAMSAHLSKKSTRREAIWRNYTLMAAYTANSAKSHAASAATDVIEEILVKIRPFAEQDNMDRIFAGVRRVVKYAIDTWRYARLEKEMIVARLETEADDAVWGHHPYHKQFPYVTDLKFTDILRETVPTTGRRKLLLHLLPLIYREGTVTLTQSDALPDDGRVFTPGVALYSDCLPVLHRKLESGTPTSTSIASSPGEDARQRRREGRTNRDIEDLQRPQERDQARIKAERKELEMKEEMRIMTETERLEIERKEEQIKAQRKESENREALRIRTEQEELEKIVQEEARIKAEQLEYKKREEEAKREELRRREEARIKAEEELNRKKRAEFESKELAKIQAQQEEQRRKEEEARIKAETEEEEAWENALREAEQFDVAVVGELEEPPEAIEAKEERERLEQEAELLRRAEIEAQRAEDEARERALREYDEHQKMLAEAEMLAKIEAEIRDAEEAEAQLVAEAKARKEKLRLEAEAKAAVEEEKLEKERLKQRDERRMAVRAKIEAEVAARKLERERERQRMKAEAEEREREEEKERLQAQAEAEAEAQRLRLESEAEKELLEDTALTAEVGGGVISNLGATEEADGLSDGMSDAEVSTLGRGIAEAASILSVPAESILSMGAENLLRGFTNRDARRGLRGSAAESLRTGNEDEEKGFVGKLPKETRKTAEERVTEGVVVDDIGKAHLADEGASMIWLRLSEPEAHSEINQVQPNNRQELEKPIVAYKADAPSPVTPLRTTEERSIFHAEEDESAAVGDTIDVIDEVEKDTYSNVKEEVEGLKMGLSENKKNREGSVGGESRLVSEEDVHSIYSDAERTYLSEPEETHFDEEMEEVDIDDESFDSCGADVGGEDDEDSDAEREQGREEGVLRGMLLREGEDGNAIALPLPPVTLEGETPGGVELAKFDFGLEAESDGEEYGLVHHDWHRDEWGTQHGIAESSGEEEDNETIGFGNVDRGQEGNSPGVDIPFVAHAEARKHKDGEQEEKPDETRQEGQQKLHITGQEGYQGEQHIESRSPGQETLHFWADSHDEGGKETGYGQEEGQKQSYDEQPGVEPEVEGNGDHEQYHRIRSHNQSQQKQHSEISGIQEDGAEVDEVHEDSDASEYESQFGVRTELNYETDEEGRFREEKVDKHQEHQLEDEGAQVKSREEERDIHEEFDGSEYGSEFGTQTELKYETDQEVQYQETETVDYNEKPQVEIEVQDGREEVRDNPEGHKEQFVEGQEIEEEQTKCHEGENRSQSRQELESTESIIPREILDIPIAADQVSEHDAPEEDQYGSEHDDHNEHFGASKPEHHVNSEEHKENHKEWSECEHVIGSEVGISGIEKEQGHENRSQSSLERGLGSEHRVNSEEHKENHKEGIVCEHVIESEVGISGIEKEQSHENRSHSSLERGVGNSDVVETHIGEVRTEDQKSEHGSHVDTQKGTTYDADAEGAHGEDTEQEFEEEYGEREHSEGEQEHMENESYIASENGEQGRYYGVSSDGDHSDGARQYDVSTELTYNGELEAHELEEHELHQHGVEAAEPLEHGLDDRGLGEDEVGEDGQELEEDEREELFSELDEHELGRNDREAHEESYGLSNETEEHHSENQSRTELHDEIVDVPESYQGSQYDAHTELQYESEPEKPYEDYDQHFSEEENAEHSQDEVEEQNGIHSEVRSSDVYEASHVSQYDELQDEHDSGSRYDSQSETHFESDHEQEQPELQQGPNEEEHEEHTEQHVERGDDTDDEEDYEQQHESQGVDQVEGQEEDLEQYKEQNEEEHGEQHEGQHDGQHSDYEEHDEYKETERQQADGLYQNGGQHEEGYEEHEDLHSEQDDGQHERYEGRHREQYGEYQEQHEKQDEEGYQDTEQHDEHRENPDEGQHEGSLHEGSHGLHEEQDEKQDEEQLEEQHEEQLEDEFGGDERHEEGHEHAKQQDEHHEVPDNGQHDGSLHEELYDEQHGERLEEEEEYVEQNNKHREELNEDDQGLHEELHEEHHEEEYKNAEENDMHSEKQHEERHEEQHEEENEYTDQHNEHREELVQQPHEDSLHEDNQGLHEEQHEEHLEEKYENSEQHEENREEQHEVQHEEENDYTEQHDGHRGELLGELHDGSLLEEVRLHEDQHEEQHEEGNEYAQQHDEHREELLEEPHEGSLHEEAQGLHEELHEEMDEAHYGEQFTHAEKQDEHREDTDHEGSSHEEHHGPHEELHEALHEKQHGERHENQVRGYDEQAEERNDDHRENTGDGLHQEQLEEQHDDEHEEQQGGSEESHHEADVEDQYERHDEEQHSVNHDEEQYEEHYEEQPEGDLEERYDSQHVEQNEEMHHEEQEEEQQREDRHEEHHEEEEHREMEQHQEGEEYESEEQHGEQYAEHHEGHDEKQHEEDKEAGQRDGHHEGQQRKQPKGQHEQHHAEQGANQSEEQREEQLPRERHDGHHEKEQQRDGQNYAEQKQVQHEEQHEEKHVEHQNGERHIGHPDEPHAQHEGQDDRDHEDQVHEEQHDKQTEEHNSGIEKQETHDEKQEEHK